MKAQLITLRFLPSRVQDCFDYCAAVSNAAYLQDKMDEAPEYMKSALRDKILKRFQTLCGNCGRSRVVYNGNAMTQKDRKRIEKVSER